MLDAKRTDHIRNENILQMINRHPLINNLLCATITSIRAPIKGNQLACINNCCLVSCSFCEGTLPAHKEICLLISCVLSFINTDNLLNALKLIAGHVCYSYFLVLYIKMLQTLKNARIDNDSMSVLMRF